MLRALAAKHSTLTQTSSLAALTVADEVLEADAVEAVEVGHAGGVDVTLGRLVVTTDAGPARVAVPGETLPRHRDERWGQTGTVLGTVELGLSR